VISVSAKRLDVVGIARSVAMADTMFSLICVNPYNLRSSVLKKELLSQMNADGHG
jgi:flagellar assembly factor FliW